MISSQETIFNFGERNEIVIFPNRAASVRTASNQKNQYQENTVGKAKHPT